MLFSCSTIILWTIHAGQDILDSPKWTECTQTRWAKLTVYCAIYAVKHESIDDYKTVMHIKSTFLEMIYVDDLQYSPNYPITASALIIINIYISMTKIQRLYFKYTLWCSMIDY